jgi:magnesium transporter
MRRNLEYLEDDAKEKMSSIISHRIPWLVLGLAGGILATIVSSRYENLLSENVHLAFFIPVIVYMSDALGTQTETIYVRNLAKGKVDLHIYLIKEFILGIVLGTIFGLSLGLFAYLRFGSVQIATAVGLALTSTMASAPVIAVLMPTLIAKKHIDPALGAGPFTTIIQDLLSIVVYFLIASLILLR